MEFVQDEDVFFHSGNITPVYLNYNALMLRNTPYNRSQKYKSFLPTRKDCFVSDNKKGCRNKPDDYKI
jgi:hypothetical protein